MLSISPKHRIFLAIAPIDFRKGIDGIVRVCQHQLHLDPKQGHYFIFRNRRKSDIKIIYYDSQGFCLLQKRLSSGRFNFWPTADNPLVTLTPAQAQVLLYNGDPKQTQENPVWLPLNE